MTDHQRGVEQFTEYFVRNYPGPDTVIFDPKWHAPKIFRAAISAYLATTEPGKPESGVLAVKVNGVDWLETGLDIIHEHKRVYAVQRDDLKQRGKGNQHVYAGFVGVCDSISQAIHDARNAALSTPPQPVEAGGEKAGIYIASKTKHAERWRVLRDHVGEPIISTWIDEAGQGESGDLADLWRRCIEEASRAKILILYREPEDVLKGGWIELGAALASGVTVFAVGIEEFTVAKDTRIKHFPEMKAAIAASRAALNEGAK